MSKIPLIFFMAFLVFSCSKPSDQDYLNQSKDLVKEKKITQAINSLQTLLKEFPDSKLAPKALTELATIYQGNLDTSITARESFNRAQKYFKEVYDKYPKSEEAPNALFMSAFILANDLHKYDEATITYKLFIEKFPDNPLVQSAKDELDNMGLTPDEILKRKEVASQ